MTIFLFVLGSLVMYLLGMAGFYGLGYYLFGKPDGQECEWWDTRKYHDGAFAFAVIFYPFVLPFMAARLIGFKKRMALMHPPKPKTLLEETVYRVGGWKEAK